jgi:Na+-driven multidrug efflux pump
MFAFVIPMALGISLTPFVSQNFGADRIDRVREAQKVSTIFALSYCGLISVVFFFLAPSMAQLFSRDPKVISTLVSYIRITCFGYGMMEVHRYCGFFLTGLHKPVMATALNAFRILALLIPLSYLGARLMGINGVFVGRLLADITGGTLGFIWTARQTMNVFRDTQAKTPHLSATEEGIKAGNKEMMAPPVGDPKRN